VEKLTMLKLRALNPGVKMQIPSRVLPIEPAKKAKIGNAALLQAIAQS
jgi:hypothetical protein